MLLSTFIDSSRFIYSECLRLSPIVVLLIYVNIFLCLQIGERQPGDVQPERERGDVGVEPGRGGLVHDAQDARGAQLGDRDEQQPLHVPRRRHAAPPQQLDAPAAHGAAARWRRHVGQFVAVRELCAPRHHAHAAAERAAHVLATDQGGSQAHHPVQTQAQRL